MSKRKKLTLQDVPQVLELRVYTHNRREESLQRAQLRLDEEAREAIAEIPESLRFSVLSAFTRIGVLQQARTITRAMLRVAMPERMSSL